MNKDIAIGVDNICFQRLNNEKSLEIKIEGLNKVLSSWRKVDNSLSSSTFQKIKDAFIVYYKYLNFNLIKSIFLVFNLSINFLKKRYL